MAVSGADQPRIRSGQVIVTDLDSDYRVHKQYFGYLTYKFVTDPTAIGACTSRPDVPQQLVAMPVAGPPCRRELHPHPDVAPPHPGAARELQFVRGLASDDS